jgi:hypothetical protein
MVAAFGLDERPLAAWVTRAGRPCQPVHPYVVQPGQVDLQHVQADELWVKRVSRRVWMAMAMASPPRWWGGVLSAQRDWPLITRLGQRVRPCGRRLAIRVGVDGLASDGRRADAPALDEARTVALSTTAVALGGREALGPSTQAGSTTSQGAGSMTTVGCGATCNLREI